MAGGRGPVFRLNRTEKARMVEAVVQQHRGRATVDLRVLDIGCGNGDIAEYFAENNHVTGVDVQDLRRPGTTFEFQIVDSARLPYADAAFDLVISHHVIEHIPDQATHLAEIHRVLAPGGAVYLATPNLSSPIMEGHVGNEDVLRWRAMRPLFESHGFQAREVSVDLLVKPKRFHTEVQFARWIPRPILNLLRPVFPSHVFILERAESG